MHQETQKPQPVVSIPSTWPRSWVLCLVCAIHILSPSFAQSVSVLIFVTSAALPTKFTESLRNEEATEGATVLLHCQLSKEAPVEWKKGTKILRDGDRYSLRQDGAVCELQICGLAMEDAGEYSCVCGQERTSATLTIKGKDCVWSHEPVAWCLHVCYFPPHVTQLW
jgi:hypothetical protein